MSPADGLPQPLPGWSGLPTGDVSLPVTMVSPAGHRNDRGPDGLEPCMIRRIDPLSAGGIRCIRHARNDGYGGSGSGLSVPSIGRRDWVFRRSETARHGATAANNLAKA